MGVVHKGRDPHLGRELAVKVLREPHQDDPQAVRRFLGEARIAGQLQHPGVVPVYELDTFPDGRPFFTMKLVHGRTLAQLLAARREPGEDLPRLLKVYEQVCQTVAYAHSRGIIHRDLKPANVMVGAFGEVQVMDWGLAKVLGEDPAGPADPSQPEAARARETEGPRRTEPDTEPGAVLGTCAYMAPEQARGAVGALDERCDVFGLGAILCEILTGQPPYTAPESWQVYPKAVAADLAEAHGRLKGCGADPELVALAKRCLAAEPGDRPRDAGEVAEAVAAYQSGVQERLRRAELERTAAQTRTAEERRRQRLTAALAAAVLLLFAVGGGGWLWVTADRAERRARTEATLALALDKAERLQSQARQMARDDPHTAKARSPAGPAPKEAADDRAWEETVLAVLRQGLAAAEQAKELGTAGSVGEEPGRRTEQLLAELREAVRQARRDARMLVALDEARMARSVWKGRSFDYPASARLYEKAFTAYGLDLPGSSGPAPVVQALRQLPPRMRRALVLGLDDWAMYQSNAQLRRRLLQVAAGADDDPWRNRLRQAPNLETLKKFAQDAQRRPLPAVSFHLLGARLLRGGALPEAVALLRAAQRRYPGDFWINFDLGQAFWNPGGRSKPHFDEAIAYYRAAVALRPDNAPARNNLGLALKDKGDMAGAIAEFRAAVALDPKLARAYTNLGNALDRKGDLPRALAAHRKAIALDTKLAWAHDNLGAAYQAMGDWVRAIAEHHRAIQLDPQFPGAYYNLGNALLAQGDVKGAIAAYHRALALDPQFAAAYTKLGAALEAVRDLKGAVAAYRRAIQADPQYQPAYTSLGNALRASGDHSGAIAAYRRSIQVNPQHAMPHNNLGNALCDRGDLAGAIAEFRWALALDPKLAAAHNNLGTALKAQGDIAGAIAAYRRAIAWDPKYAMAHYNLGNALLDVGDLKGAIAEYHQAVAVSPQFAEAHCRLGSALLQEGLFKESLAAFRRGHELGRRQRGWGNPSGDWVRQAERRVELDKQLPAFLQGKCKPRGAGERLELAQVCFCKKWFAASACFYRAAFTADSKLKAANGYDAARAAALAGCGQGRDAAGLKAADKAELRRQALECLRADVRRLQKCCQDAIPADIKEARGMLADLLRDPNLAGVRDKAALAKLPEAERQEWANLWSEVAALLHKAGQKK
jgi:serine/threonine-protein kinase